MLVHSAIFTVVIAVIAVAMNGTGMLASSKPNTGFWASSGFDDDNDRSHKKSRWDHDDD